MAAEHPIVAALSVAALLIDIGLVGALAYYLVSRKGFSSNFVESRVKKSLSKYHLEISLVFVSVATAGSLYMSNVLGWTPCRLCWFQRIFMYPLVLVTGSAILFEKRDARDYVLPLSMIGFGIAVYHSVIQRFEQFHSAGCSVTSVSCETTYTFWFGYISTPVLAATVFAAVIVLMWKFADLE